MTGKWMLDPGGFLPFPNLLRDNSDVLIVQTKQGRDGFIIWDVIIRRHIFGHAYCKCSVSLGK